MKQLKAQETYLDPTRYSAQFNGTLFEFNIDANEILINGLRFNVDDMGPDPDNAAKWYIRPHNTLIFITKEGPQASNMPSYSYQRKN